MTTDALKALCAGVLMTLLAGCGPLRLDNTPGIRGTLVGVHESKLSIRHKTGRTYDVVVTPDTRIRRQDVPVAVADLCPGLRAHVRLAKADRAEAAEVEVYGRDCR